MSRQKNGHPALEGINFTLARRPVGWLGWANRLREKHRGAIWCRDCSMSRPAKFLWTGRIFESWRSAICAELNRLCSPGAISVFNLAEAQSCLGPGRSTSDEELARAVKIAKLDRDVEIFPQGLETLVGERGVTLSGGQKQRATLARALVMDPPVLILDDCLSSVDAQTEAEILHGLQRNSQRENLPDHFAPDLGGKRGGRDPRPRRGKNHRARQP